MDKKLIENKLLELRLNAIAAYEDWAYDKSIKSTQNKISGFGENDILMKPDAMQHMINMLENERATHGAISDFGRSKLKRKEEKEDNDEIVTNNILNKFGRSHCITEDNELKTAIDGVQCNLERKIKESKDPMSIALLEKIKILEKFMRDNNITESFRCKSERVDDEQIATMLEEANSIELDDEADRHKILSQIKKIKNENLFDFCDRKPHQCLMCPYYYKDFMEFSEMMKNREKMGEMMNDENNEIKVFKLSQSPLFNRNNNSKINIHSEKLHDDMEYARVLSDAKIKGFAVIIDGDEPTDEELIRIKEIYDKFGAVKIFRKRQSDLHDNIFEKDVFIKPSDFKCISGTEIKNDEVNDLKQSVCHYIVELIKN